MEKSNKGSMYFFIVMICILLGVSFLKAINGILDIGLNSMQMTLILQYGFILLPALTIMVLSGNLKERIKIKKIGLDDIIIIIIISVLTFFMTAMINVISTRVFHNFLGEAVASFPKMGLLQWLFVLAVTPAINEEVIMRGLVLSEFKYVSHFKAAMVNGLLFGILHLNINQFIYAFIIGAIMSYMVIITKSLLSSMLMHFSINGVAAVAQWYASNSSIDVAEQQAEVQEILSSNMMLIICGVGAIIIIAIISAIIYWWAGRKDMSIFASNDRGSKENHARAFDGWTVASIILFLGYTLMTYYTSGKI